MHPLLTLSLYLLPGLVLLAYFSRSAAETTPVRPVGGLISLVIISLTIVLCWPALLYPLWVSARREPRRIPARDWREQSERDRVRSAVRQSFLGRSKRR
jgi:hypothetical protein